MWGAGYSRTKEEKAKQQKEGENEGTGGGERELIRRGGEKKSRKHEARAEGKIRV